MKEAQIYHLHTSSFIAWLKTENVYTNISKDVKRKFDTSNYEVKIPSPSEKNNRVFRLMEDELAAKTVKKFSRLRPKMYSYLTDDGGYGKKQKHQKMCNKARN